MSRDSATRKRVAEYLRPWISLYCPGDLGAQPPERIVALISIVTALCVDIREETESAEESATGIKVGSAWVVKPELRGAGAMKYRGRK